METIWSVEHDTEWVASLLLFALATSSSVSGDSITTVCWEREKEFVVFWWNGPVLELEGQDHHSLFNNINTCLMQLKKNPVGERTRPTTTDDFVMIQYYSEHTV